MPHPGQTPRIRDILVVEDDPDQRDLLRLGFKTLGLDDRVEYAADCAEAWRAIDGGGVRVVLSDLCLGFESGLDLLLALEGRGVVARALYSAAMPEDLAFLAREHGISVLVKGVRFHREVPEAVARLLSDPSQGAESAVPAPG
ncbi:response regulator [Myxococcota bacterium]|nr:response regulator [Myxococcota bacterium]